MHYGFSRRRTITLATALAVATTFGRSVRAAEEGPDGVVERLHALLSETLREAATLGFSGRFQRLAEGLESIYDFPLMARLAVGDAWASADDEQRLRLIVAFRAMSVATYARRFDAWAGQNFDIVGQRMLDDGGVVIETMLHPGEGQEPVALDYRLRQGEDGWRVIDVYLTGTVSELATRRAEFATVVRDQGLDGLIAALEAKGRE
jgi:phospholipid transport system substrate-binding protein